jgi:trehalose 6-phosphate phosphatase
VLENTTRLNFRAPLADGLPVDGAVTLSYTPIAGIVDDIEARLSAVELISLFLDFDGTLVPIEPDPRSPRPDQATVDTLKKLAGQKFLVTTIISGRAVEDLYSRIRVEGIIYAGNHGLEIFGRNLHFVEATAWNRRGDLERVTEELSALLVPIEGTLVENKGLTASIHYRQAQPESLPAIQDVVRRTVARYDPMFLVTQGRKVLEIVPATNWNKGSAVGWINGQLGADRILSIYAGDDSTDERAFRTLPDAVTIKVGHLPETDARYRLPDPGALQELLLELILAGELRCCAGAAGKETGAEP